MKKIVALLLAVLMLSGMLAACTNDPAVDIDDLTETLESIFDTSEPTDTESETNGETEPEIDEGSVLLGDAKDYLYTVVVSRELESEERLKIRDAISNLFIEHDIKLEYKIESPNDKIEAAANEILVGFTGRQESKDIAETLRPGEYVIDFFEDSHRLCIIGSTSELTVEAFEYFISTYADLENKQVVIPKDLLYAYRIDYPLLSVAIDGVDIRKYSIVIPSTDDLYAYYTALNLSDYFKANLGAELNIIDDDEAESDYEILIGETNRDESKSEVELYNRQYTLAKKNGKLVLRGYDVYVAAGAGKFVADYLVGEGMNKEINVTDIPEKETVRTYVVPTTKAKNVILMIGDGMGFNHVNVTLNTQLEVFSANNFISKGSAVTRSQSVLNGQASYTDSAAAATALSSGHKTINGYIGKDANGNNVKNVRELADEFGAKTAVVTTDAITGATPSGFLAHNISRNNTSALQAEIDKLVADGKIEYCKGDAGDDLTVHTRAALQAIAYTDAPFFMMVEEAHIDKRSHDNNLTSAIDKVIRYNDAIIFAATFTLINSDTVLIITADHETGGLVPSPSAAEGYKYTTGNHTNADVPVYALGAGTEIFNGVATENTDIAKFIAKHFGAETFGGQVAA